MKQRLPTIITVLLIAAAIGFFALRRQQKQFAGMSAGSAGPEDVVWRLSDATREGNVKTYLDCFTGRLRQKIEKTAREMGEAQFSEYLKRLNNEVTGIAVSDLENVNQSEAALRVEFVFRGKNEVQKHHFRLVDGSWKIEKLDGAEQIKTLVPYGTDVDTK